MGASILPHAAPLGRRLLPEWMSRGRGLPRNSHRGAAIPGAIASTPPNLACVDVSRADPRPRGITSPCTHGITCCANASPRRSCLRAPVVIARQFPLIRRRVQCGGGSLTRFGKAMGHGAPHPSHVQQHPPYSAWLGSGGVGAWGAIILPPHGLPKRRRPSVGGRTIRRLRRRQSCGRVVEIHRENEAIALQPVGEELIRPISVPSGWKRRITEMRLGKTPNTRCAMVC